MKLSVFVTAVCALAVSVLGSAQEVRAHASYNIAGYSAGIGGSVGSDGLPANPGTWTNGNPITGEYAGGLPVQWYSGMHSTTDVRTIQTGAPLVAPPNGSLLQQTNTYNAANDPDLPTDLVLGVGGLSWSDPGNGNQGWGHGLDFGLVHFSPIGTLLAGGPVNFTITLTDDPSDGVATQLAFALYGGWDTNPSSSRHQTFTTNPAPVNNPLGSSGLTLIDYVVASGAGRTLSRTYNLDGTYNGEYTVIIGALGGTPGQYQLTVTTAPAPGSDCEADLAQCQSDLGTCEADLATATTDSDGDGTIDSLDACPDTPADADVDQVGCSIEQFCSAFDVTIKDEKKACKKADWKNDEPVMKGKEADCVADKETSTCIPKPVL